MAVAMNEIVKVRRGKLLSCDEAAELMGISGHQVRLYIRMRLMHAERVGRAYVIRSEQLALVSERFHQGFYTDAPAGRNGSINHIELE
jgi:excisionase family DNA binding protein